MALFLNNSLMILDSKQNKARQASYSIMSKCLNFWRIDSSEVLRLFLKFSLRIHSEEPSKSLWPIIENQTWVSIAIVAILLWNINRNNCKIKSLSNTGHYFGDIEELDDTGTYFDLGLRMVKEAGIWRFFCTRNNNFTNRSQKGEVRAVPK